MNNIKRNVIFTLESRKKEGKLIIENVPIRLRVSYAKQRIEFTTGYRIDSSKWDSVKQRVKNNCTNKFKQSSSDINSNLDKYSNLIQAIFKEYEVRGIVPTPKQLKNSFEERLNDVSINTSCKKLTDAFDDYIKECSNQNNWAENTKKKLITIKNHLIEFDNGITFDSLTIDVLNNFVDYMQKRGLRNNTIKKQLSRLKTYLRWGIEKKYTNNNVFESFKPKIKTTAKKVIFLNWDELNQLREFQIPNDKNYLERVRDVFLFQCYTGLRHSDVYNLKRSNIKNRHIEIISIKTTDSLIIDFNKYSQDILDKYKEYHFENDKALPVISNQKMNEYLKEIA